MSIGDFFAFLGLALIVIGVILGVLINLDALKRRLNRRQKFILTLFAEIVALLIALDGIIIGIIFLKLPLSDPKIYPLTIGVFGMIVIVILEIVMHYRRKNKLQKVKDNFTEVDWEKRAKTLK